MFWKSLSNVQKNEFEVENFWFFCLRGLHGPTRYSVARHFIALYYSPYLYLSFKTKTNKIGVPIFSLEPFEVCYLEYPTKRIFIFYIKTMSKLDETFRYYWNIDYLNISIKKIWFKVEFCRKLARNGFFGFWNHKMVPKHTVTKFYNFFSSFIA